MLPFILDGETPFENGDYIFVPAIKEAIKDKKTEIPAYIVKDGKLVPFTLKMGDITRLMKERLFLPVVLSIFMQKSNFK